jgi:hypothetical protein
MTAALRETKEEAGLSKVKRDHLTLLQSVLGIRIRKIRMFLGHPDPLVRGTEYMIIAFLKKVPLSFRFCKACC